MPRWCGSTGGRGPALRLGDNLSAMAGLDELLRGFADLGFARVDTDREARQGAPEGIVAEGKTPEEIEAIARALLDEGAGSVMVTRADADARAALRRAAPGAEEGARARPGGGARAGPRGRGPGAGGA